MTPTSPSSSAGSFGRASSITFWAALAALCLLLLFVHRAAGLTLPAPWGDEAFFVWQARAFQQSGSFISPELEPTRPYLLLPFVYQGTLGLFFKAFGFSLENARLFSFVCVIAGFGFLACAVRRHTAPLVSLVVIACFLLNSRFVAMANNARMEAYVFMWACLALLLIQNGRFWLGLAALVLSPMIHPNGVFFLFPALVYTWFAHGLKSQRPSRGAVICLAVAVLAWVANGLYALYYWDGFVHDLAHRVGETTSASKGYQQYLGWPAVGLLMIIAVGIVAARRRVPVGHLLTFAVGAWLYSRVRLEQWYEPIGDFAYLLLILSAMEVAASFVPVGGWPAGRGWRMATATGVALLCLFLNLKSHRLDGPHNYLAELESAGMRAELGTRYFPAEDRAALAQYLAGFKPGQPIVVEVYPWADGLLLANLDPHRIRIQVPYFDEIFYGKDRWAWGYGPTPETVPDLYLVHDSRYVPVWLKYRHNDVFKRALKHSDAAQPAVIHTREETEIWYAIQPRPGVK